MRTNIQAKPVATIEPKSKSTQPVSNTGSLSVWLALLAVYVIWGSTYLAIRFAIEDLPPFLMAGIRFVVAGGLMYAFLRLRGTPNPTRKEWGAAAIVGLLLLAGGNGLVSFAEQYVASGLAALSVATVPIFAALFAGIWKRWPTEREWLGLGIGFVGVILLNLQGDMRANPLGAAALIFATASWAFGSVWSRYLPMPKGPMASAAEMLAGGAVLLVLGLANGEHIIAMPGPRSLFALIYLIIFGSIVAFTAYSFLLQRVRPSLATSYAYVNPVVAIALGIGLAGEQVTLLELIALPIILAGVAIVVLAKSRA
jgi:drug/metabolite transporter (DMT)-like permease